MNKEIENPYGFWYLNMTCFNNNDVKPVGGLFKDLNIIHFLIPVSYKALS